MSNSDLRELIHIAQALLVAGICAIVTHLIVGDE
jgi:hypothetical protein